MAGPFFCRPFAVYTTEGDNLFAGGWLTDYLAQRTSDVRGTVERFPKLEFQKTDDETLTARILGDLRVDPLVLDVDCVEFSTSDTTLDAGEESYRAARLYRTHAPVPATRFAFTVPFEGNPQLWALRPNIYAHRFARGNVHVAGDRGTLELVFTEPKDSKADIHKSFKDEIAVIEENRELQRPLIETFNTALRGTIANGIQVRRKEFASHEELAKRMGVTMKESPQPAPEKLKRGALNEPPRRAHVTAKPMARPKQWHVFVSYAGEDRAAVAMPLADMLRTKDLKVWFDKFELTLGDHLRRKIDEGLANSRFGVVVLSHAFFSKHWPQAELDGLAQREVNGQKVILPVWHGIDRDEVARYSPTLADRIAAQSSDGIEAVVASIMGVVGAG